MTKTRPEKSAFGCFSCGKKVLRVPHRVPKSGRVACSRKCSGKWRLVFCPAPVLKVRCASCRRFFTRKKSLLKQSPSHFCSRKCYVKTWAERMRNLQPAIDRSFMRTPEYREAQRISHLREKSSNWKGGLHVSSKRGYGRIPHRKNDLFPAMVTKTGYTRESRLVAAKSLQRPLLKEEVVHHENGNPLDNGPENLVVFASHSQHMRHHAGKLRGQFIGAIWSGNPAFLPKPQPVAQGPGS